ncbi:hypothetical protein, partial [Pectobacterium parmentieri]|uniref:hypothetical protein n=1 Tax=Pectobacterium parmentieri TaxID=1905730 RepID=UPI001E2E77F2
SRHVIVQFGDAVRFPVGPACGDGGNPSSRIMFVMQLLTQSLSIDARPDKITIRQSWGLC